MFKAIPFIATTKTIAYEETLIAYGKLYNLTTYEHDICGCIEWCSTVRDPTGFQVMTMDYCLENAEWVVTDCQQQLFTFNTANPALAARKVLSYQRQLVGA